MRRVVVLFDAATGEVVCIGDELDAAEWRYKNPGKHTVYARFAVGTKHELWSLNKMVSLDMK